MRPTNSVTVSITIVTRLQHQDGMIGIFCQTPTDHQTGQATTNHHEIIVVGDLRPRQQCVRDGK